MRGDASTWGHVQRGFIFPSTPRAGVGSGNCSLAPWRQGLTYGIGRLLGVTLAG